MSDCCTGKLPVEETNIDQSRSQQRCRPALYPRNSRRYRSGSCTTFNSLALCLNLLSILVTLAPTQYVNDDYSSFTHYPIQNSVSISHCSYNAPHSTYQQRQTTSVSLIHDPILNSNCPFISFCPNNLFTCLSSQQQITPTSLIIIQRASNRPL